MFSSLEFHGRSSWLLSEFLFVEHSPSLRICVKVMRRSNDNLARSLERARELCDRSIDSLSDRDQLRVLFDEVWQGLSATELRELGPVADAVAHALFRYGSLAITAEKSSDNEAKAAIDSIRRLIQAREERLQMRL